MVTDGRFNVDSIRESSGKLPAFAWPGGYPVLYLFADSETCCPACANGENGSEASTDPSTEDQWRIVAYDIHWEGPPETCAHCGADIESAYGNPKEDEPEDEPEGPSPEDYTITDTGPLGSLYSVGIVEGRSLGTFRTWDDVTAAIHADMARHNFYPNVWRISDHGNVSLVTLD